MKEEYAKAFQNIIYLAWLIVLFEQRIIFGEHVLPIEGNAKYSWLDCSNIGKPDNKSDLQPPEEVLSPSDIAWEEGETCFSYLGDNGESYTV